jgi:hypothetical protein
MRRANIVAVVTAAAALAGSGCSGSPDSIQAPGAQSAGIPLYDPCGETLVVPLVLDSGYQVGTVAVSNDFESLDLVVETNQPWEILSTQLAVSMSLDGIPQTPAGNPILAKFPVRSRHAPAVSYYAVSLSMEDFDWSAGEELFLSLHADLRLAEGGGESPGLRRGSRSLPPEGARTRYGAWGDGLEFPGNGRGLYFNYALQDCDGGKE